MVALSSELRDWLVPGLAGTIASVDAEQRPQIARVWAAWAGVGDVIEVYVLRLAASGVLEGIANSGRAALNLIEVATYRSRLFKGRCEISQIAVNDAALEHSLVALNRVFHDVGMPLDAAHRLLAHCSAPRDMVALSLSVDSVFDQSPKRGAGARL
jgi:hypothetical protein